MKGEKVSVSFSPLQLTDGNLIRSQAETKGLSEVVAAHIETANVSPLTELCGKNDSKGLSYYRVGQTTMG